MTAAQSTAGTIASPVKADPYANKQSVEFRFRERRFERIRQLIQSVLDTTGHCSIIDLGGTEKYWLIGEDFIRRNRQRLSITVVNTEAEDIRDRELFSFIQGSATAPDLGRGRHFDLVHSNSVIEHVGSWQEMQRFAENTRRLAPRYYVQTPNYWFPYEPHFRFPGFQYLPKAVRVRLIMRWSLGFFRRIESRAEADDIIFHHRLLSAREMRVLFPDAEVSCEKVFGLNKSILAVRDMPAA